jgi:catechol 2,3-dioxygenase-like lactoylglutathione lyase family enzyme
VTARRIGFVGLRVDDPSRYARTVAVYRDALGLPVVLEDGDRSTRFRLADGSGLHVYGPGDVDHLAFADRMCVGIVVDDVDAARAELLASGIEVLDETERDGDEAWFHYRAPDGSVQEVLGPDGP